MNQNQETKLDSFYDLANSYARAGVVVFSIPPTSKKATVDFNRLARPPKQHQVKKWRDNRNLAVLLGSKSNNLVCMDFDDKAAYRRFAEHHKSNDLNRFPITKTSKGFHVYVRVGDSEFSKFLNQKKQRAAFKKYPFGELKLERSYCLVPPSVHPSGVRYEWTTENRYFDMKDCYVDDLNEFFLLDEIERPKSETGLSHSPVTYDYAQLSHMTTYDYICRLSGIGSQCEGENASYEQIVENQEEQIKTAILSCIPAQSGKRDDSLFRLARKLKSIFGELEQPERLHWAVEIWHAKSKNLVSGEHTLGFNKVEFTRKYRAVSCPSGASFDGAIEIARERPARKLAETLGVEDWPALLLDLFAALDVVHQSGKFYLPTTKMASYLNDLTGSLLDRTLIYRQVQYFVSRGVIEVIDKGDGARRRAATYRWIGGIQPESEAPRWAKNI